MMAHHLFALINMYNLYTPPWLIPLLGEREKRILLAKDCKSMQCLPESIQTEEERLPSHQQYIVSIEQNDYFMIDGNKQMIIS